VKPFNGLSVILKKTNHVSLFGTILPEKNGLSNFWRPEIGAWGQTTAKISVGNEIMRKKKTMRTACSILLLCP
jgi:hypothetical protein